MACSRAGFLSRSDHRPHLTLSVSKKSELSGSPCAFVPCDCLTESHSRGLPPEMLPPEMRSSQLRGPETQPRGRQTPCEAGVGFGPTQNLN